MLFLVGLGVQGTMNAAYDPSTSGNADAILNAILTTKANAAIFHLSVSGAAMLLVPFAAGLFRRLRGASPVGALAPAVAGIGLVLTAMVLVLGSGLDTEFGIFVAGAGQVVAENVSLYNHWIGTIPCLWIGAGLAGIAVHAASGLGGAPRWLGTVGLVLGGLTLATGLSPLPYLAGLSGAVWLLVTAIGFAVGDRAHRLG